jgi:hypothetical protein
LGCGSITVRSSIDKKFIRDPNKDGPAFKLLEVSTQIYAEVAILPYSLNAFYFPSIRALRCFLYCRSASSIQAIKTLELPFLLFLGFVDFTKPLVVQFKGLELITLHCDVSDESFERSSRDEMRDLAEALRNAIPGVKVLTLFPRGGTSIETYY